MKLLRPWKIIAGLFLITAAIIGLAGLHHPILFKWLSGSARIVGRPINATVYTDGQLNPQVKVYHVKKYWNGGPADYFILYFPDAHESRLQYMILNRQDHVLQACLLRQVSATMIRFLGSCFKAKPGQD